MTNLQLSESGILWIFHWISLVIMLNLSESRIFVSAWIWVLGTFLVTEPIEVLHLVTLGAASENLNTFFQDFTDSHWWAIWICQNLNFWCQPVFWCQTLSLLLTYKCPEFWDLGYFRGGTRWLELFSESHWWLSWIFMNPTPEYQPELWCQPLCESKTYMLGLLYYRGSTTHLDALFLNDSLKICQTLWTPVSWWLGCFWNLWKCRPELTLGAAPSDFVDLSLNLPSA